MSAEEGHRRHGPVHLPARAADPRPRHRHPLWAKILHWLHLAAMLVLIFSGFYITYATRTFLFPTMRAARQWHFYAMYILVCLWSWILALQALTGFVLYDPNRLRPLWLHPWLLSLNTVRAIHFLLAWFFAVTVAAHLYLVIIGGWDELREMAAFQRDDSSG